MSDNLPNTKTRYPLVDVVRGVAIVLMIIFHGAYDLNLFGFVEIDFFKDQFWYVLPRIIVFLFLLAVGFGLTIAHRDEIKWSPFWKRFGKVAICAVGISIGTYFMFPKSWVYFGTLHCIALTSLLALPFLKHPKISLAIGLLLTLPHLYFGKSIPWILMEHKSMDYIPPFPWLGVVLFGVFATHQGWHKIQFSVKPLEFLGRHSLLIYMIHQPILYGLVFVLYKFTTPA